jgi:hypothetical protein
LARNQKIQKIP